MTYAQQNDIQMAAGGAVALVGLADWNGDGVADVDVIAQAQAAADGMIDGHLRLKLTATDLAALRTAPTPTIVELAAAEAVYWMKKSRGMVSPEDIDLRKERERQLDLIRAGQFRPADSPSAQRATFIENCHHVSRKGTKGMW